LQATQVRSAEAVHPDVALTPVPAGQAVMVHVPLQVAVEPLLYMLLL
jgi:hypothetical protein